MGGIQYLLPAAQVTTVYPCAISNFATPEPMSPIEIIPIVVVVVVGEEAMFGTVIVELLLS